MGARRVDPVGDAPQYPIESVDNALRLLLLLGERQELRLTDVSAHLGVATSTAHRLLAMLLWRGFMRQDPQSKLYLPGPALTDVAHAIMHKMDIPRLARPILSRLADELGETCHLGSLQGHTVQFLEVGEPEAAVRVASRVGKSFPAHCTSTGKALLAELSDAEILRLYPDEHLEVITSSSLATRTELMAELDRIRDKGYAVNRGESEDGVASVAVVVDVSVGRNFAINASAPIQRLPLGKVKAVARVLQSSAIQLATAMR